MYQVRRIKQNGENRERILAEAVKFEVLKERYSHKDSEYFICKVEWNEETRYNEEIEGTRIYFNN